MLILYSPLQMAADLPENYQNHPAMGWIETLPTTFSQTQILEAEIGDYLTLARKQGDEWYLAGIANEDGYYSSIQLDFLDDAVDYTGIMYKDSTSADYRANPYALQVDTVHLEQGDRLNTRIAPGGGFALRLIRE